MHDLMCKEVTKNAQLAVAQTMRGALRDYALAINKGVRKMTKARMKAKSKRQLLLMVLLQLIVP